MLSVKHRLDPVMDFSQILSVVSTLAVWSSWIPLSRWYDCGAGHHSPLCHQQTVGFSELDCPDHRFIRSDGLLQYHHRGQLLSLATVPVPFCTCCVWGLPVPAVCATCTSCVWGLPVHALCEVDLYQLCMRSTCTSCEVCFSMDLEGN